MLVPNRHSSADSYRYGFQGQEKDDEIKGGKENSYDFGARMLDSKVGRWFARDPLEGKHPYLSPYNAFENNPVIFIDPDGKDAIITISGNTITVKSVIYIDNSGKNKINVADAQNDIMKVYGGNHKSGKYSVKFDIVVMEKPISSNPIARGNVTGNMPDFVPLEVIGSANIVVPKEGGFRSNVHSAGGNYGEWASGKRGTEYAHEVGHILGLADLYTDTHFDNGNWDPEGKNGSESAENYDGNVTELMAIGGDSEIGNKAKLSQRSIDAIKNFAVENQKDGVALINSKSVNGGLAKPTPEEIKKLDKKLEGTGWKKGKKPNENKKKS